MGVEGEYTYKYPRPALTVDCCILKQDSSPKVLLIKRKRDPFEGSWALPGGFVDEGERIYDAAKRELKEETGVDPGNIALLQVGAYGDPGRDPRGWTVSAVHCAILPGHVSAQAGDDAAEAEWFDVSSSIPSLAFDHQQVLSDCFAFASKMDAAQQQGMAEALQSAASKLKP